MTISAHKKEQLSAFLGGLPNATALKLFAALEADRLAGGEDLPHGALLGDLRAQLLLRGAILPSRKVDAKRLFFTPFEDFFIGRHAAKKRRAQIARTSLEPIWRMMMTDSALTKAAFAAASLDDALASGAAFDDLYQALFIAAEAGFGRLAARTGEDAHLREDLIAGLGGENAFQDMLEIGRLLPSVDHLRQLQAMVSAPAPALTEEQLYEVRRLFLSAYGQSGVTAVYLLLALKGRLEKPWRALGVYYHLARSADDKLRAAREIVMALPESLFEDIEDMARALEHDCAGPLDAATAMLRIDYFADYADGLVRQATKIGDNVFMNRVEACREIAGAAHDRFAEQALSALRTAMPVRHAGGSSRLMSLRPDIAIPLSPATVDDAHGAVALMMRAAATAERLGADPSFAAGIAQEAADKARIFAKDLVVEIRAAEREERKAARRMLEQFLNIAAPLLTSDETGLIRDRAAAAALAV